MAEEFQQQERTETATPKRREEARKKGQVARSIEINSAFILFVSFIFFYFYAQYMYLKGHNYMQILFENIHKVTLNESNLQPYLELVLSHAFLLLAPVALLMVLIGLAINFGQVGFMFTLEPMTPKFSKVNPLKGFKRIFFSKKALVEFIKGIIKIVLVGLVAYYTVKGEIEHYIPLMDQEPFQILAFIAQNAFEIGIKIALLFIGLAFLDYMFQRYDYEQSIKMTKQEVKEELKQMEGDPHIKARIRSIQREQAQKRMMDALPTADVVITNPVHLAVALKYDLATMDAPTVVAKGARLIAEKIKRIAREHDIPIVENKPLAQALYKACEVGDEIPETLFQAAAEVLAYVYRLKKKRPSLV